MKGILKFLIGVAIIFVFTFFDGWIIWKELCWFGPMLNIPHIGYLPCVGIATMIACFTNMTGITRIKKEESDKSLLISGAESIGTKLLLLLTAYIIYILIR